MGSTRTRFRLASALAFLAIASVVFIVAYRDVRDTRTVVGTPTSAPTLTPALHPTYTYLVVWPSLTTPWHGGESLTFTYRPMLSGATATGLPDTVECTIALFGPYRTAVDASTAFVGPVSPGQATPTPAWRSPALTTTDWLATDQHLVVTLPSLAPGYYFAQDTERISEDPRATAVAGFPAIDGGGMVIEVAP